MTRKTSIISEGTRDKQAQERTLAVIRELFENAPWLDDVLEDKRENPNGLTYIRWILYKFEDEFYHSKILKAGPMRRLEPLIAKIAIEAGFLQDETNTNLLARLKKIMFYMSSQIQLGKLNVSNIDINSTTFDDLNSIYGEALDNIEATETERIKNTTFTPNPDYTIVDVPDFATAKKYGDHSCPEGKLCYTQDENTWNNYTNFGTNRVYVILSQGWQQIPPVHNPNMEYNAYDEYGLSMIFVFVNMEGNLTTCNVRWNHNAVYRPNADVDYALNREDISRLVGFRFFDKFKPYDNNYYHKKGLVTFDEINFMLENGVKPEELFERIYDEHEGVSRVEYNQKFNFLTSEGKLLSPKKWFDGANDFVEGFSLIWENMKGYNFIDKKGQLLTPNTWYEFADDFQNGYAEVEVNDKPYKINKAGTAVQTVAINENVIRQLVSETLKNLLKL